YILYMQYDCNLVLYKGLYVIWDTKTNNMGNGCTLYLKKDGNLAIYDLNNKLIWSKYFSSQNEWVTYALCVENAGYFVVSDTIL
ncbi:hypothetical protein SELMODRAFT_19086, partial [Selaginella moellendorffii]